jgi:hypothetical protein
MSVKILKLFGVFTGSLITVFGSLGILFGIITILDPVGSKLSDDSNPLGTPPTTMESLALTAMYLLIFGLGIVIVYRTYNFKGSNLKNTGLK